MAVMDSIERANRDDTIPVSFTYVVQSANKFHYFLNTM